jgi:hypothetical protein
MVTVTEGQDSVSIKFKATAPPSFYCSILDNKDSCHVKLSVTTVIERYGDLDMIYLDILRTTVYK